MRTEIYATHGIVLNPSPEDYRTMNYLDSRAFEHFMAKRKCKFVPLPASLAGLGDSLTIDDSTKGGMDAALLARYHGHAVSLFVNGMYTEHNQVYPFVILSCLVEQIEKKCLSYGGDIYYLMDYNEKRRFREKLKLELMRQSSHQASIAFLRDLQNTYEIEPEIAPHFRTLTKTDIEILIASGVDIQNHGWTHRHPFAVPWPETLADIASGRNWIRRNFAKEAPYFAVPYGISLPRETSCHEFAAWFMLEDVIDVNVLAPKIINRRVLQVLN